jgi:hypothetical protein
VARAHRHALRGPAQVELRIHVAQVDLTVKYPSEEVDADRAHQRFGERVADKPLAVCERSLGSHHRRGSADAGGQIPAVIIGSGHSQRLLSCCDDSQ